MHHLRFSGRAALLLVAILAVEVLIALYVHRGWVRGFLGDVLVVAAVYYLVATFLRCKPHVLALGVFLFACAVEVSQGFDLVSRLGLEGNRFARIVLGSTFDGLDIVAYAFGSLLVWQLEGRWGPGESTGSLEEDR